jgi:NAD(P)-dependent dehydrogenase (short-subunit alcohol dehydrogenase family)
MMTLEPIEGERGVLVNTSSAAATEGQMGQAAYSAAKAAIVGMTLTIARDLSREGIRVNTIQPGIFNTPAMSRATPQMLEALGSMVPFPPRLGHSDEFASMALEMIRNGYINGATVRLDGAIRMQPR